MLKVYAPNQRLMCTLQNVWKCPLIMGPMYTLITSNTIKIPSYINEYSLNTLFYFFLNNSTLVMSNYVKLLISQSKFSETWKRYQYFEMNFNFKILRVDCMELTDKLYLTENCFEF